MTRHVERYCQPLTVERHPAVEGLPGPAVIIANHTSHFDTLVALAVLPERIRSRTAVAAAADRFYARGKRGWWFSLFYNAFPIDRRRGGSATLAYPIDLLRRGWSVLLYPEGTRSPDGGLGAFHHGVSLLATQARVPVVPIYSEGLRDIMPKGQRSPGRSAAVRVRVGAPEWLDGVASIPEGTTRLERVMRELAGQPEPGPDAESRGAEVALTP
jgi:1-acyl-sn-glycerol-3-phosphate acyltransferase